MEKWLDFQRDFIPKSMSVRTIKKIVAMRGWTVFKEMSKVKNKKVIHFFAEMFR